LKPAQSTSHSKPNIKLIALLSAGHLIVDTNQGAIPAILPFLKDAHNLTYSAIGTLVLVSNLTSSIIQPLFGYLADRRVRRWMLPLSLLMAGMGMGLMGFAPDYWSLTALLALMGVGVASYHPEGYKSATSVAGSRKATALSWFSVGGNVGFSLGPPMITILIAWFGMGGSLGMLMPCIVMGPFLFFAMPRLLETAAPSATRQPRKSGGKNMPGAMALLILVVTIRSWAQLGFATFIPFYYIDSLGADPALVASLLFVFLGAGGVGTLIGGPLADRWGVRRFTIGAFLVCIPLALLFPITSGVGAFLVLGLYGGVLVSTFTTTVVLGQAYLPDYAGMASGLIVGFAIGMGGLAVAILGWLADIYGVTAILWISAFTPIGCLVGTWFLPEVPKAAPLFQPSSSKTG
jgi:FSR family fosmidomycin resistance protein-like MFS transporter